ncbi:efflux RND transporter periplasmic adaptor subunit [Ketogulonicigenium vulgare]|uniref:Efflux transporter, RND family, MFP subunit n=1 Tax=Ketogulonicigenium vulgare (strain WSH-001) TaxID=759362 RepID=F9Y520_KETVW|nr:efflux RND transporter periplasmic adaptor subunit [Ketogulonicigenium vulgare]AEM40652.1 Efflux transporter, RND family, MFP subunit [Ketogulonicigenium vulgare WSH-001]ALJ80825.1 RND transporter [Ketogulonicigenium vulgare]ANW33604.1 efflux transporter periplasmic adaptor subunit [Ketogulonicigenium vulgare]AOZ54366.1 RND family efflux transporter MFP subunit [Ketogulonicigenium vulgare]
MKSSLSGGTLPVVGTAVFALLALPAFAQNAPPPSPVGVVEMHQQAVPRTITVPGRAIAAEETLVRPRVNGIITRILYQAGRPITAGTPMFEIEPAVYEAAVVQAQSNVASADAGVRQAQSAFDRAQRLVGSGTTQADVESAQATLDQALASYAVAESTLNLAQLELGWTTVVAPIDGMASVSEVSIGDLVSAAQASGLATVTTLDPIEVDLYGPAVRLQQLQSQIDSSRTGVLRDLQATLTLEDGRAYETAGQFVAPGFSVSTTTGTIETRFSFENPDFLLLPGMFVRGQVVFGEQQGFLVTQTAATRDRQGNLTVWVVENGTAVQRAVTDAGVWQHHWIITDGLSEGDQLIVDGTSMLAPGAAVTPVPVTIDDAGLIHDASAPAGGN